VTTLSADTTASESRIAELFRGRHPASVAAIVGMVGAGVLALVFLVIGFTINDLLAASNSEAWINRLLERQRTALWDDVTFVGSGFAHGFVIVPIAIVTAGLLVRARRWSLTGLVAVGLLVEVTVYTVVATAVGRDRPAVARLEALPTDSFPSGHVAAAVVLYGALAMIAREVDAPRPVQTVAWSIALVVPLIVALSRLYRGVHFVTDVAAGIVLGLAALAVAVLAVRSAAIVADRERGSS
jgi:undecaprenyl-diphosphatase